MDCAVERFGQRLGAGNAREHGGRSFPAQQVGVGKGGQVLFDQAQGFGGRAVHGIEDRDVIARPGKDDGPGPAHQARADDGDFWGHLLKAFRKSSTIRPAE